MRRKASLIKENVQLCAVLMQTSESCGTWCADGLDFECHHTTAATEEVHRLITVFDVNHFCQQTGGATHRTRQGHLGFLLQESERKKERKDVKSAMTVSDHSVFILYVSFSYLFVLGQTLCVAQSFAAAVHLQHERLVVAVGAAVGTAGHGQVVYCTETVEAGVTAELVDGTGQDHLMFALQDGWQKKSVLFQKWTLQLQGQRAKGLCVLYNVIHRTILQIWECGSH